MELNVETIKSNLRVNHSLEDDLIEMYLDWAEDTVRDSVVGEDEVDQVYLESNFQYQKAVVMLTSFFYEQRMAIGEIDAKELPYSILDSIQKLRGNSKVFKDE